MDVTDVIADICPAVLHGVEVHQVCCETSRNFANLLVGSAVEERDLGHIAGGVVSADHDGHQVIDILDRVSRFAGQR